MEVRAGQGSRGIGAPKWRALLAALLLGRGTVVSVEGLINELWPSGPPAAARKLVSGYTARVRGLIGDGDGAVLVTRPPGYALLIDRSDVDAWRFEDQLVAGREALNDGDASHAVAVLGDALALWRGAALADVPQGPAVSAEAERLEELRLAATGLWYEASLRCGEPAELIPGLRRLVADHPLNERFWLRLMQALEASGRPGEALQAYARVRQVLEEELGADPGPELQQLHQRILTEAQQPAGSPAGSPARSSAGGAAPQPAVPRQLPPAVRNFVGRATEQERLFALLDDALGGRSAVAISAVGGTPGVGKTALAVHWAHRAADRFPDGQLYVDLRGFGPSDAPVEPDEAIAGFLEGLGIPGKQIPASLSSRVALYRTLLSGKRMLVLLDNARESRQVQALLPGSPGCLVLVTSRSKLTGLIAAQDAYPVSLDVLTAGEAHELLRHRLGRDRLAADPAAAGELVGLCAGLPLALSIVAANAAAQPGLPLSAITAGLRDSPSRLDTLSGGDGDSGIRAVFSWSYRQLSEPAARMFRLVSLHPGTDISLPAAASLAGLARRQARGALAELTAACLISEHPPGRYAAHDLLRAYAAEQCSATDTATERRAAVLRVLDYYLHAAHTASKILHSQRSMLTMLEVAPPGPEVAAAEFDGYDAALTWFAAERHVLMAVVAWAADVSDAHAMRIPLVLRTFLHRTGHWHDCALVSHTALAAAGRLGNLAGQAHAHRLLSSTYVFLNAFDDAEAHARQALILYERLGYPRGQGDAHVELAHLSDRQHRPADALHHAGKAMEQFKLAGYGAGQAAALNNMGWCHIQLGNFEQALPHLEQALDLQRELGDRHGIAATWDSIGHAHFHLGRYREALQCYNSAHEVSRALQDAYQRSVILVHLADAHQALDDQEAARLAWSQALGILTDLGHPDAGDVRAKLAAHAAGATGG
jgi:DNA-binding SARP family transcriptional activator/tetratricopeptide (TPR) repeat protein